jgi:hypothetical protein
MANHVQWNSTEILKEFKETLERTIPELNHTCAQQGWMDCVKCQVMDKIEYCTLLMEEWN